MQFYDTSHIPAELAKRSFAAGLARIMPNGAAPLYAMSGLAKKKTAKQIEHGYWTKTMEFVEVTLSTAVASAAATNFEVNSTVGLKEGDIIRIQSAFSGGTFVAPELVLVDAVVDATNLTVTRGFAGTTAKATIALSTKLQQVGNAHEEGSNRPASRAIIPQRTVNYTQIFRNSWDITGTMRATQMEVGDGPVAENKMDCAAFHSRDIELATFFGRKSMGTKNGKPLHTMDGIEALIEAKAPQNLKEAAATTNYDELEAMLNPLLDMRLETNTSNARTIFCGSQALTVINNIGRLSGQYNMEYGETGFGLRFKTFKTTRGDFNVIEHPIFNTNDEWKKMAVVMDLSSFDFAYLEGRDTRHDKYNEFGKLTDGKDAEGGVLTTELTIELINPFNCGIIYGLTQAAA